MPPVRKLATQRTTHRSFLRALDRLLRGVGIAPMSLPEASATDDRSIDVLIGHVQSYIDTHPSEDLSLDRLSNEVHLSKYHFARRFKAETGQTPWAYVQEARVDRAKTLLTTTECSLTEIALRAGFCDQSHLTRTFKRFEDVTPGAYREQHTEHPEEENNSA
jgi:AraC-like DNA-binding protein